MAKPITGQYEFVHRSGVGLDYFTSRVDRLTIQANGRFVLIIQDRSRMVNAAQSLINGQQVAPTAPETRREGNYTVQGNIIAFRFDDGTQEQGQLSWNGDGLQFGPNFFNKVSDSTLLPPTHRLKKDMDDIAKGLKIASTIGGMAVKAAKTIHDTIQPTQEPSGGPAAQTVPPTQTSVPPVRPADQPIPHAQPAQPAHTPSPPPPIKNAPASSQQEALFCDQCGARARPGKRFCNNCGAQLP
ncbi:MAG: zinc ribbon domain-containing protein [Ktedonobacteraceae bacterium]